jgi:cell division transport system permease protein
MFISLKRIFHQGWLSFSRDGGLVAATVFIMALTILLVSSLFLLRSASQILIASLQEKADISVYFREDSSKEDILNVKEGLAEIPEVKEVKYVSKEQALADFVERYKDDPLLMESVEEVGGNPFLASLNIRAWQASQYQAIANLLERQQFMGLIEKVDYFQRKSVIDRVFSLTSTFNRTGIFFSFVLITLALLVSFNTVRLAIYNLREEIQIQRLVGASNWFIRGPFLVQGAISGIFAALISLVIFALISWILGSRLESVFSFNLFQLFVDNFWSILFLNLITGIGLGVVSSSIAVRKYLKV